MRVHLRTALAAAAALALTAPAFATGNTSAPSNWRLLPGDKGGAFDGLARLQFTTNGAAGTYVCSGSLLAGGQYVVTAAHCADDIKTMQVDFKVNNDVAQVTRGISAAYVHHGWNGTLDTGADIAILKLDSKVEGIAGFKLSTTNDVGKNFLMAGFGSTGVGSAFGSPNWDDWGYAHYGWNTFDVTSKVFSDAWDGSGDNTWGETYVADFDSFDTRNPNRWNTLQRVADLRGNLWSSGLGLGADEALIAGGDSGGGDYIWTGTEWLLTGVHSWGWQFCGGRVDPDCDFRNFNSSSFGDLMGSTAIFSHIDWINSITAVPEPETYALMLMGLGLVAFARRRAGQ